MSAVANQNRVENGKEVEAAIEEADEEQYFTDPDDIIDLSRLSDSVIRVSPTPDSNALVASAPSKVELLRSLSYLESELQAADAAIAALRASKSRLAFYQAKYVRLVLPDTFSSALGASSGNQSSDQGAAKSANGQPDDKPTVDEESQMGQLENLIEVQRRAHACMTVQLEGLRNKLKKASRDLIDERCKHEQDSAEGDDVLAGLGKERERLLNELEFERSNNRRQEKELKRQIRALEEIRSSNAKQKAVALEQIRQRKQATAQLKELTDRCRQLESQRPRLATSSLDPAVAADKAEAVAAAAQHKVAELGRQAAAEAAAADRLAAEVESLRLRLTANTAATSSASSATSSTATSGGAGRRGAKPEPPVRRTPETPRSRPPGTPTAASASTSSTRIGSSPGGTPGSGSSSRASASSAASRLPMNVGGGVGVGVASPKRAAASSGGGGSARVLTAGTANGK
ncbi:hypothetical protein BOX15_Mlig019445g4 [Macrostomum lignano]|uniref:Cortactin-binding protein-2 N-terminal domain-containing protein n=1 Tax=Macrostomum lignano TaxID=282301 RepID=A0A267H2Z1_9PLAT|nr:hypothetical protein BOX15_Mlig019445g1 [Macrostomum lignano]PAA92054.1 hypothetical protein BOX15_Mlig019445g4 [Macrostomum lignano]